MYKDDDGLEYDEHEMAAFASLPREAAVDPAEEERLVRALKAEGLLGRPTRRAAPAWRRHALQLAAAVALLVAGGLVGAHYATRNSLETLIARQDLSLSDRVLLLQRAGSAYVQAAQNYADATSHIDSTAVEVASKVLLGAAHAVARQSLDGGVAAKLTAAFAPAPGAVPTRIWF